MVLPQRNVLVSLAILLVVIAISVATELRQRDTVTQNGVRIVPTQRENNPQTFTETDTDKDGLKDWEEELWKTSKNNPDTDGDGTPDGEEVAHNRDPLFAGPNDSLDTFRFPKASSYSSTNKTTTQDFAETVFSQIVQSNNNLSADELSQQLLNSVVKSPPRARYSVSDLTLSYDNTKERAHTYGNELGSVLIQNAPGTENEIAILERFVAEPSEADRADLESIVASYMQNKAALLAMTVPSQVAQAHIAMILGFDAVAEDLSEALRVHEDPVATLPYFYRYTEDAFLLVEGLQTVSEWLDQSTSFTASEPGYTFVEAF